MTPQGVLQGRQWAWLLQGRQNSSPCARPWITFIHFSNGLEYLIKAKSWISLSEPDRILRLISLLGAYHSTCRPLSSSPPREQLCNRSCSNKHTHRSWISLCCHCVRALSSTTPCRSILIHLFLQKHSRIVTDYSLPPSGQVSTTPTEP